MKHGLNTDSKKQIFVLNGKMISQRLFFAVIPYWLFLPHRCCISAPRYCHAKILSDLRCYCLGVNTFGDAVRRLKPISKPFRAATRITLGANDNQMLLLQTIRPVKRAAAIEVLNRRSGTPITINTHLCLHPPPAVSAEFELLPETNFNL
jgi:hypothetical protein